MAKYAYPLVFEREGTFYMLPDSAQNGTIDAYRYDEFPHTWSLHKTLMKSIRLVDSTLFESGGRWWLFGNVKEHEGVSYSDELFLYYADFPSQHRLDAAPG